jgi:hypothetical protein
MALELKVNKEEFSWLEAQVKLTNMWVESQNGINITATMNTGRGKVGMLRLWRKWIAVVAKFMADNGVTMPYMIKRDGQPYGKRPFNADDAHELFTAQFLGLDERGNRLSWVMSEGDNVATKEQRYIAMTKLQAWCFDKGISLPIPRDSEYHKMKEQMGDI